MKLLALATAILAFGTAAHAETRKPAPAQAGTDFAAQVRTMFRVAACGGDASAERFPAKTIERHCRERKNVRGQFVKLWRSQPRRALPFRFGYPDSDKNHRLMITRPRAPDDAAKRP